MLQFDANHRNKFPVWFCLQVKVDLLSPNIETYQKLLERRSHQTVSHLEEQIKSLENWIIEEDVKLKNNETETNYLNAHNSELTAKIESMKSIIGTKEGLVGDLEKRIELLGQPFVNQLENNISELKESEFNNPSNELDDFETPYERQQIVAKHLQLDAAPRSNSVPMIEHRSLVATRKSKSKRF
jgi:chromosome segregation ATPase